MHVIVVMTPRQTQLQVRVYTEYMQKRLHMGVRGNRSGAPCSNHRRRLLFSGTGANIS